MIFIQLWEVLTCGSPTSRTSNGGRSSPRLANDLWFTHMLNVQRWEVFASACDLWFTHVLNAFVNTNTVTRGSTARATHRAVPLPNRRRPPKVLVCLQKFILCPPFRTHASSFSWLHPSINFTKFCREKLIFPLTWDNHGFGKLCPKGLDTLEIKRFCGALGPRCGGNGARPCRAGVR